MSNLLLIDQKYMNNIDHIIRSRKQNTEYIIIQDDTTITDLIDEIKTINFIKNIKNIGFVQENYSNKYNDKYYNFVNCKSILSDVKKNDPLLESWTEYKNFLDNIKNLGIDTFDFISCEIKNDNNWTYVLDKIANNILIKINTSDKKIGAKILGGSWNLNNDNLIGKYFTEDIKEYKYVLGPSSEHTAFILNKPPSSTLSGLISLYPSDISGFLRNNVSGLSTLETSQGGELPNQNIYEPNDGYYIISCGKNDYGQLGIGDLSDVSIPKYMILKNGSEYSFMSNVIQVSCGENHTAVLDTYGYVYTCGDNTYGQLGNGTIGNSNVDGSVNVDNKYLKQVFIDNDPDSFNPLTAGSICCGANHTVVLDISGGLHTCGKNQYGQLGISNISGTSYGSFQSANLSGIDNLIIDLACGEDHTLIKDNQNYVYATGKNDSGQLGNTNVTSSSVFTKMQTLSGVISNIAQITCGSNHNILRDNSGYIWGCGDGSADQLPFSSSNILRQITIQDDSNDVQISKIACGEKHTLFKDSFNDLWGCGNNEDNQLFNGKINQSSVSKLKDLSNNVIKCSSISCGKKNSYYQENDSNSGKIKSCGKDDRGQCCGNKRNNPNKNTEVEDPTSTTNLKIILTTATQLEVNCFNEDTTILCIVDDQEVYIKIQDIRNDVLVKTFGHGNRKVIGIDKRTIINDPNDWLKCMYTLLKSENPDITEDLIVTGGHSILVDKIPEDELEDHIKAFGNLQIIDGKYLELAGLSKKFKKINKKKIYTYYHIILENDGNNDARYGIWANGVLTETPSKNYFDSHIKRLL